MGLGYLSITQKWNFIYYQKKSKCSKSFFIPEDIGNLTQVNKSTLKFVREKFIEYFPNIEPLIDEALPKKATLFQARLKTENKTELIFYEGQLLCYIKDKLLVPSLKFVHKWSDAIPKMQVDKGGIKFVIGGANVMAPGLLTPGGKMDDVEAEKVVVKELILVEKKAITGEGKQHAMAIGITKFSTAQIRELGKGIVIENVHHLGDDLWKFEPPKMGKPEPK